MESPRPAGAGCADHRPKIVVDRHGRAEPPARRRPGVDHLGPQGPIEIVENPRPAGIDKTGKVRQRRADHDIVSMISHRGAKPVAGPGRGIVHRSKQFARIFVHRINNARIRRPPIVGPRCGDDHGRVDVTDPDRLAEPVTHARVRIAERLIETALRRGNAAASDPEHDYRRRETARPDESAGL